MSSASPATHAPAPAPARMPARTPRFQLHKDKNTSTIHIEQWTITTVKRPILNIQEVDSWEKSLGLPLPEMTFGNNYLSLSHDPSISATATGASLAASPSSGESLAGSGIDGLSRAGSSSQPGRGRVELKFYAYDALAGVAVGEGWEERVGGGVRVAMADKWGKNRSNPSALLTDVPLPTTPVKPHDWTFSSTHAGSVAGPSTFEPSASHEIPMALLARQDPILDQILFYDDVPLFEDELHDNGESILNARIRVMPHCFFILARLFLRVDNVLFRIYDVRIYHAFGSGEVIREVNGMEAEYDVVKAMLEKPSDLSPLTDPNFVSRAMAHLASHPDRKSANANANERHRSGKPWPGLGKRVEVMRLPRTGIEAAQSRLSGLDLT